MPSDLEGNLVDGGLSPTAAKLIANAIDNASTGRLSTGRQLEDVTPVDRMRLIDANTRRYVLTNLDYPAKSNPDQYQPSTKPHPYQDSQPATSNPSISTPGVTGGKFVQVGTSTTNEVSQSQVTLNIQNMGGPHARLNSSTGVVESVPILLQFEPEGLLEGEVVEEAGRTVIRIRVIGTALRQMLKRKLGAAHVTDNPDGVATLYVDGAVASPNAAFVLVAE